MIAADPLIQLKTTA